MGGVIRQPAILDEGQGIATINAGADSRESCTLINNATLHGVILFPESTSQ